MADAIEAARRYDDAFNAQDAEARKANQTSDIEVVMPGGMILSGPEQVAAVVGAFWEALPDAELSYDHQIEAGDAVVTEGTLTGTHTGTFRSPQGEIAATGSRVHLRYASIRRIRRRKVASEHLYFDQLEFLQQLGALPST